MNRDYQPEVSPVTPPHTPLGNEGLLRRQIAEDRWRSYVVLQHALYMRRCGFDVAIAATNRLDGNPSTGIQRDIGAWLSFGFGS